MSQDHFKEIVQSLVASILNFQPEALPVYQCRMVHQWRASLLNTLYFIDIYNTYPRHFLSNDCRKIQPNHMFRPLSGPLNLLNRI
jgi:hypothetical protein